VVEPDGPGAFELKFTPSQPAEGPVGLLGEPLEGPRQLRAKRLPGQKLELCDGERCATLERGFDPYDHDLR